MIASEIWIVVSILDLMRMQLLAQLSRAEPNAYTLTRGRYNYTIYQKMVTTYPSRYRVGLDTIS